MERGAVVFAIVFVILPLALFGAAILAPSYAFALAFVGLLLVATGFTMGAVLLPR